MLIVGKSLVTSARFRLAVLRRTQQLGRQWFWRQAIFDRPLQIPELGLDIFERFSDLLDLLDSELAAQRRLARSKAHGVHIDQAEVRIESPPDAVGQPISLVAERERLVEKSHDCVGFRQAARVRALVFGAEGAKPLGPLFCGPGEGLVFSEPRLARNHVGQLGHPALELDVREHHVHERPREGRELGTVGLGEETR
jgi:hypothetical protein